MSAYIEQLEISNFKSVRNLKLDCERVNVFIGKPNAGKSNILEAISLLGAGYSGDRFMEGFIRYKTISHLFFDFQKQNPITIIANKIIAKLEAEPTRGESFSFSINNPPPNPPGSNIAATNLTSIEFSYQPFYFDRDGVFTMPPNKHNSPAKKYAFTALSAYKEKGLFLHPPYGENFYFVLRSNTQLREEIKEFLKPNGLELLRDEEIQEYKVAKKTEDSIISFPFYLIPETFQRYIFHVAAILSNKDSVLLLEEPETHSYAPFVYQLAQHIIDDDRNNQYFLTTHNPYLLTPIMQEMKDVAIFVTWFENYQTHARRLSEEEIRKMLDYGVDIFMNLEQFIPA